MNNMSNHFVNTFTKEKCDKNYTCHQTNMNFNNKKLQNNKFNTYNYISYNKRPICDNKNHVNFCYLDKETIFEITMYLHFSSNKFLNILIQNYLFLVKKYPVTLAFIKKNNKGTPQILEINGNQNNVLLFTLNLLQLNFNFQCYVPFIVNCSKIDNKIIYNYTSIINFDRHYNYFLKKKNKKFFKSLKNNLILEITENKMSRYKYTSSCRNINIYINKIFNSLLQSQEHQELNIGCFDNFIQCNTKKFSKKIKKIF